jgi:hypothetical protein
VRAPSAWGTRLPERSDSSCESGLRERKKASHGLRSPNSILPVRGRTADRAQGSGGNPRVQRTGVQDTSSVSADHFASSTKGRLFSGPLPGKSGEMDLLRRRLSFRRRCLRKDITVAPSEPPGHPRDARVVSIGT